MTFQKYQLLARKVFPNLPSNFEQLPDAVGTYQLVFTYCCPREPLDMSKWSDLEKADFFSLDHWTVTKLRELAPKRRSGI